MAQVAETRRRPRHNLPRVLALVCVVFAGLLGAPQRSLGASASVSAAPQADGSVKATVTGSFASCVVCDVWVAGNCTQSHTVNSGSIVLYLEGSLRCPAAGNGSATCTKLDDRGLLHGTHVYSAIASEACGGSATENFTLTLDNTPTVAVTAPSGVVSEPFDITGTATFKPTLDPIKGSLQLYVASSYVAGKSCPTESCAFSYNAIVGHLYTLAPGGPYTVQLKAISGGTFAIDVQTFTVASCTDADLDGHFAIDAVHCPPPLGDDCDDTDGDTYPGALEQCNATDNNCNGVSAEGACDTICPQPFGSSLNVASGALEHDQELLATSGPALALPLTLHYHSLDRLAGRSESAGCIATRRSSASGRMGPSSCGRAPAGNASISPPTGRIRRSRAIMPR